MKEKFLQFFTGKMSKALYISIAAAVVCGAVVITSVVVVHNNNQKIDAVLESLSASESVTETVTESVTESVSVSDNTESQPQAKAANNEPAGDKALQYLAEYNALTEEYQKKRAELEKQAVEPNIPMRPLDERPTRKTLRMMQGESEENFSKRQAKADEEYSRQLSEWEVVSSNNIAAEQEYNLNKAKSDEAKRKLEVLEAQYQQDVANLKAKYGIS